MCFQDYEIWRSVRTEIIKVPSAGSIDLPEDARRVGLTLFSSTTGSIQCSFYNPLIDSYLRANQRNANSIAVPITIYEYGALVTGKIQLLSTSGSQWAAIHILPATEPDQLQPVE